MVFSMLSNRSFFRAFAYEKGGVVGTLWALEANDSQKKLVVPRSEPCEVLHGGGSQHTPVHQSPLPFRIRTFRLSGAVVPSYNFGPNRLKHAHMKRIGRSISNKRLALSWMTPRRYKNWFACLYLWLAASMTSGGDRDV